MTTTHDQLNAMLDYVDIAVPHKDQGPLQGLSFGVKDIFDMEGYPTGGGNPQREIEYGVADATAPAIKALLDAGARFVGKTQTDELTYSMTGTNAHFPSPINVKAPGRVTGGSSSGSVAAVAGGLCDFAIGSDTNGSIRAPASYCGLIGLRTTQARISLEGAMPLAPSFDTFGWFARDADIYAAVGRVLLGEDQHRTALTQPMRIEAFEHQLFGDAESLAYDEMLNTVLGHFEKKAGFLPMPTSLDALYDIFRIIQAYEAWQAHGAFLSAKDRDLGPGVKERFAFASTVTDDQVAAARRQRTLFVETFSAMMKPDMVIIMPTQPSAAPLRDASPAELDVYRNKALVLTSVAGLLGWPQITLPLGTVYGAPFGISLLGPKNSDMQLIHLAASILAKQ